MQGVKRHPTHTEEAIPFAQSLSGKNLIDFKKYHIHQLRGSAIVNDINAKHTITNTGIYFAIQVVNAVIFHLGSTMQLLLIVT